MSDTVVGKIEQLTTRPAVGASELKAQLYDKREAALREIALQIDGWMLFDKAQRDKEGLTTNDDTNIIAPPVWPSHGQLKEWVKVLTYNAVLSGAAKK